MIAALVNRLIAAGVAPDVAAVTVAEAYAAGVNSGGIPVDAAAERRRAYDRERKRKSGGNPRKSAGIPETTISIEESKKEKKDRRGSTLPPEWAPNESHYAEGQKRGHSREAVDDMARDMRDWAGANENRAVARKSNWDLTFHGWIRRQKPGKSPPSTPSLVEQTGFYASFSSKELEAWEAYERISGKKHPRDRAGGWRFPTQWPPNQEAAA